MSLVAGDGSCHGFINMMILLQLYLIAKTVVLCHINSVDCRDGFILEDYYSRTFSTSNGLYIKFVYGKDSTWSTSFNGSYKWRMS